jgi:hypothetical protein
MQHLELVAQAVQAFPTPIAGLLLLTVAVEAVERELHQVLQDPEVPAVVEVAASSALVEMEQQTPAAVVVALAGIV